MPLYKVLYVRPKEDSPFSPSQVWELKPGSQKLTHFGVSIPIRVTNRDGLTVNLKETTGELWRPDIDLTGDKDWHSFEDTLNRGRQRLTLRPRDREEVITISGGNLSYVTLERHRQLPKEYLPLLSKES